MSGESHVSWREINAVVCLNELLLVLCRVESLRFEILSVADMIVQGGWGQTGCYTQSSVFAVNL